MWWVVALVWYKTRCKNQICNNSVWIVKFVLQINLNNYSTFINHSAGKRPGPNPPSPNHHFPQKMFFLQASFLPLNGKSKLRKKNFWKFLNFSENFDSATILIVWNRQFQQCFRQPSRCPTNMPLGSSCCLWPKSPRLNFMQIGVTVFELQRVVFWQKCPRFAWRTTVK